MAGGSKENATGGNALDLEAQGLEAASFLAIAVRGFEGALRGRLHSADEPERQQDGKGAAGDGHGYDFDRCDPCVRRGWREEGSPRGVYMDVCVHRLTVPPCPTIHHGYARPAPAPTTHTLYYTVHTRSRSSTAMVTTFLAESQGCVTTTSYKPF